MINNTTTESPAPVVDLYTATLNGHRRDYLHVLSLALERCAGCTVERHVGALPRFRRAPIVFAMLDERLAVFFVMAIVRNVLGLRTVGLFFRAAECFKRGWKYRLKRILFVLLHRLRHVSVLTILPFVLEPRFAKIAHGWIYDPQLWDTPLLQAEPQSGVDLIAAVRSEARGRRVLVALGGQDRLKGFDVLVQLWCSHCELRDSYLFVVAGQVAPAFRAAAAMFEERGGLLYDRFLQNAELQALYAEADAVWCCYARDYDQASGIFGRAVQAGIPAIVRSDAMINALADHLGHPVIALTYDDLGRAAADLAGAVLVKPATASRAQQQRMMMEHSVSRLAAGIGALQRAACDSDTCDLAA